MKDKGQLQQLVKGGRDTDPGGTGCGHNMSGFASLCNIHPADDVQPLSMKGKLPAATPETSTPYLAPSDPSLGAAAEQKINAHACRSQLGERTFAVLRSTMLQQQEFFIEQLWELHRLARTQGRKTAILAAEAQLSSQHLDKHRAIMSQQQQQHLHKMTMNSIGEMEFIPSSLKRTFIPSNLTSEGNRVPSNGASERNTCSHLRASDAPPGDDNQMNSQASKDVAAAVSSPFTSNMTYAPLSMNLPCGQQALGYNPLRDFSMQSKCGNDVPMHWPGNSAFPGALPMFNNAGFPAMAQNASHIMPGMLPQSTFSLGQCGPQYPSVPVPQNAADQSTSQLPAHVLPMRATDGRTAAPDSQIDVSELLGMVAPGLNAQPDVHSQWFTSNLARGQTAQDISAGPGGMNHVMEAAPLPRSDLGYAATAARSNNASLWSGSTFIMAPGMAPMQQQQPGINGFVHQDDSPMQVTPGVSIGNAPGMVLGGVSDACGKGSAPPPNTGFRADAEGMSSQGTFVKPASQVDESAASILMSLKGSSKV